MRRVVCADPATVIEPIVDTTIFTIGANCIEFEFTDRSGNVGKAVGTLDVRPPVGGHIDAAGIVVVATDMFNVPQPVTGTLVSSDTSVPAPGAVAPTTDCISRRARERPPPITALCGPKP